jgi:hypothetical protein
MTKVSLERYPAYAARSGRSVPLLMRLGRRLVTDKPANDDGLPTERWSIRWTLLLAAALSAVLWGLIFAGIWALVRAFG